MDSKSSRTSEVDDVAYTREKQPLALVRIEPGTLDWDEALAKSYQAFSAEILRLALLGIGGIGVVVGHVPMHAPVFPRCAVVFFGLSGASALAHRYVAVDCVAFHVEYVRRTVRRAPGDGERAITQMRGRNSRLAVARHLLTVAAVSLGLGAFALAATFWA